MIGLTMSQVRAAGDEVELALEGEIDLDSAAVLRQALDDCFEAGHRCLVLDMGEVTFCDSSGLGALVAALKRARARGGWVRLENVRPQVAKLFEITGLAQAFTPGPGAAGDPDAATPSA
ncbi:STAS domain-containing protein [Carbonactinospora thermoautotrophica]|uniref:Anti-sigma factor antagonist n=1 Tax=Carbonactinospora thermoautotrophica TaxID=1469144 RepID=A0A132MUL3_9ACTN|nr:STAS domain-containing protein [Carbonactinospora thermoautotrophica]KWX01541.1 Stage II sporulation protein [Carbonactinospora thermoautotrophica]